MTTLREIAAKLDAAAAECAKVKGRYDPKTKKNMIIEGATAKQCWLLAQLMQELKLEMKDLHLPLRGKNGYYYLTKTHASRLIDELMMEKKKTQPAVQS